MAALRSAGYGPNKQPIESRYKQQFPSVNNFHRLHCIQVSGVLRFQIPNYGNLHFPYDSEKQRLNGHLWQIKLFITNEDSLGVYLVNQMDCEVITTYQIKIKHCLDENSDYLWSDPDGELCFHPYGSGDHYWGTEDLISFDELESPENGYLENDQLTIEVLITTLVSDELRVLSSMNNDRDDHAPHLNISSSTNAAGGPSTADGGGTGTAAALDRATKQLKNLSEQMSQKVRLLSADALLQDKLINARLESHSATSSPVGWSATGTATEIMIPSPSSAVSLAGSRSLSPAKSVHTTSHVNIQSSSSASSHRK
jgi:hypothetical protein